MPEVSIIVPVYNVEEYLSECIDSLINQTFTDIEIICVNDGATDSSLDILNDYAKKDERIKIISKENGGLSSARNAGLDNVSGKYIYFIDSDDILCDNAIELMYNTSEEKSLDMLIFKLINFDDETKEKYSSNYYDMAYLKDDVGDIVFSHSDVSQHLFNIAVTIQSKFYKSDLIGDMRFMEGYIFEDNPFFIESILKAQRVYFLDEYLYLKRERKGSITTTHNEKFFDFIPISEKLIDLTHKYGVYDEYKQGLFEKILKNLYLRFTQVDEELKPEFFEKIRQYFLSKKDEYDNDSVFQNLDCRLKEVYYSAIESENAREYELSIKCIDLERIIEKKDIKIKENMQLKNQYHREKSKLINRSHELSFKLNELANENRELKEKYLN